MRLPKYMAALTYFSGVFIFALAGGVYLNFHREIHDALEERREKKRALEYSKISSVVQLMQNDMGRKKGVAESDERTMVLNPHKDPVAMPGMREHLVREWINIETAKFHLEKLKWCYRVEGIDHFQKCRHIVQQYLDSTPSSS